MSQISKNGNIPVNARINIKYNEDKPTISFSYPQKKSQVRGSMLFAIKWWTLVIFGSIFLFSSKVNLIKWLYSESSIRSYGLCAMTYPAKFLTGGCDIFLSSQINELHAFLLLPIALFFLYGLPFMLYYPFRKQWDKLYPKYQAWLVRKKLAIFKADDLIEREGKIFCELPIFKNIVCDFKAKGEFSDYLNEIDIREHKFVSYAYHPQINLRLRKKRKHKRYRKVNEFLWYARFYFYQKPKNGKLEVIFK